MILGNILGLITCGASDVLGTGTKGCKLFFKKTTALWFTTAGFKFDSARVLDEVYVKELQAEGSLIVINGIRTFTDNTSEDTMETLEDGTKLVANLGLYEFAAEFVNGLYFHAAVNAMSSFGNYDVLVIDRNGNILGTGATDGSFKGFTTGYVQGMPLKWATDSTGQKEGLGMQLLQRSELDSKYLIVQRAQIDFDPNTINGINEVLLSYDAVPADLATAINIKAVLKQDGSPFVGLPFADWLHTIDNVTSAVTAGDDSILGGTYILTVPALAAGEVSAIKVYDNSANNNVVTLAGDLYKSNTTSEIVV